MSAIFEDVTDDFERDRDGQRFIRRIDPETWISVLHRRTGFGWMEWETALVFRHPPTDGRKETMSDRDCLIIRGDWREELAEMPKGQLRAWYDARIEGNRNSMETILRALKP